MHNIIKTINPTTEEIIKEYEYYNISQVINIIDSVALEQDKWKKQNLKLRINSIKKLSQALNENKQDLATCITNEMGKPISQSISEIEKCIILCEYYINNSEKFLKPSIISNEFPKSYYTYTSSGIIFGIMPWNFPVWQVMRFAIPNLIIGNAILLKHSPNTTAMSLKLEQLFNNALPKNLFKSLLIEVNMAESVIKDSKISGVTITGSKKAGANVAMLSGANIKKCVLELGGNDPYIILEDADIDLAVRECVNSRLLNTGQVCIAAKRIIICKLLKSEFEKKLIECVKKFQYSNPTLPNSKLGPIARKDLKKSISNQVENSLKNGSKCIYKNSIPDGKGYYYPVTILTDVDKNNVAFKEELFGPVFIYYLC